MIQRIQTVFLLLAFIFISTYFFLSVGMLTMNGEQLMLYLFEIKGTNLDVSSVQPWLVILPLLLVLLNHVYVMFSFKNRMRQMLLVRLNYFLLASLLVGTLFFIDANVANLEVTEFVDQAYGTAAFSPLIALILNFMAYRKIRKDEALIKSLDRLR